MDAIQSPLARSQRPCNSVLPHLRKQRRPPIGPQPAGITVRQSGGQEEGSSRHIWRQGAAGRPRQDRCELRNHRLCVMTRALRVGAGHSETVRAGQDVSAVSSFDRAVLVAQWCDLRLVKKTLPWASSGHVTTRSMSAKPGPTITDEPERIRSSVVNRGRRPE